MKYSQKAPFNIGGYKGKQEHIKDLKIKPSLGIIENKYKNNNYIVELKSNEFTSVCPKTGLPDFATVFIQYKPNKNLIEEKSLKLYLNAYRNLPIFQEHATNKIMDDFVKKIKPRWVKIITFWRRRGGISVKVEVEHFIYR